MLKLRNLETKMEICAKICITVMYVADMKEKTLT